jgi:hypothetical protein
VQIVNENLLDTQMTNKFPFLCNPYIHYRVHKNLPLNSILSQLNSSHTLIPNFFKIHFNIIIKLTPTSPNGIFYWVSANRILYAFVNTPCMLHVRPSHPLWFDHPNNIWGRVHIKNLNCSILVVYCYNFFRYLYYFLLLRSKYSYHFVSNTLILCSFYVIRDRVLHRYKTVGKIIDVYNLL